MDINNIPKNVNISNEELPESLVADISYRLAKADTPFLLTVSDDDDNKFINFTLLYKNGKTPSFVKRIKFPFDVHKIIADCMTSAIIQQIKINHDVQNVINIFQNIFSGSKIENDLFVQISRLLLQESNLQFNKINNIMLQLIEKGKINFSNYAGSFKIKNERNPMFRFLAVTILHWNLLIKAICSFLTEQTEWKNSQDKGLNLFLCGNVKFMASFIDPESSSVKNLKFSSLKPCRGMLYKITNSMLNFENETAYCNLLVTISENSFDKLLLDYYNKRYSNVSASMQLITAPVFNEKLVCIPDSAGIYAGGFKGNLFPFNGELIFKEKEQGIFVILPLSDEFSTLIAIGSVKIDEAIMERIEEGWKFSLAFTYGERKYRPEPKVFNNSNILLYDDFPKISVYQLTGKEDFNVCAMQGNIRIELFNGKKSENSVKIDGKSKKLYFKLYQSDNFLGQIDYSFIKRRNLNG